MNAFNFLAVACGGGRNMAMLLGMYEHEIRPDLITFANTGASEADPAARDGEKPETYSAIEAMSKWCDEHLGVPITIVQKRSQYKSLYDNCIQTRTLPSAAYGLRSCSDKWKIQPQDRFLNNYAPALAIWNTCRACGKQRAEHLKRFVRDGSGNFLRLEGRKYSRLFCAQPNWSEDWRGNVFNCTSITKAIGYHAGEEHRIAKVQASEKYEFWYPLFEWGWDTQDCITAFQRHGLHVPLKSACYFCPSSTKEEVLWLAKNHPELYERAIAMEANATDLKTVKGLGRHWTWRELVQISETAPQQLPLLPNPSPMPCMCHDGGAE